MNWSDFTPVNQSEDSTDWSKFSPVPTSDSYNDWSQFKPIEPEPISGSDGFYDSVDPFQLPYPSTQDNPRQIHKQMLQDEMAKVRAEKPSVFGAATPVQRQTMGMASLESGIGSLLKGVGTLLAGATPTDTSGTPPSQEQNLAYLKRLQQSPAQDMADVQANAVFQAGKMLTENGAWKESADKIPGWAKMDTVGQYGETAAGFVPLVAASTVAGPLGAAAATTAAASTIGLQSAGEHIDKDYQNALAEGKSQNDAASEAFSKAYKSGGAQALIFAALPGPLRKMGDRFLVDAIGQEGLTKIIAGQAAQFGEGAVLGAASRIAENVVNDAPLMEGVKDASVGLGLLQMVSPRGASEQDVLKERYATALRQVDAMSRLVGDTLQTKEQNAIQKQSSNEEVLRNGGQEVGLQQVGQGNSEQKGPSGTQASPQSVRNEIKLTPEDQALQDRGYNELRRVKMTTEQKAEALAKDIPTPAEDFVRYQNIENDVKARVAAEPDIDKKIAIMNEAVAEKELIKNRNKENPGSPPTMPMNQSMGGSLPEEIKPGDHVSNMFSVIEKDRAEMGLPPIPPSGTLTWETSNTGALARMNKEPGWIPSLLSDVSVDPRALTPEESFGMLWYKANAKAEYNNAAKRQALAAEDGRLDDAAEAGAAMDKYSDIVNRVDQAVGPGGTNTAAGRALQALKAWTDDDFSLISMQTRARSTANQGGKLSSEQQAQVRAAFDKIEATAKAEAEHAQTQAELATGHALADIEAQVKMAPLPYSKAVLDYAKKVVAELDATLTKEKTEKLKSFFASPDTFQGMGGAVPSEFGPKAIPKEAFDYAANYGASRISHGTIDRKEWDAEMVKDMGDGVKPYLDKIWDASNKYVDDFLAKRTAKMDAKDATAVARKVKGTGAVDAMADIEAKLENKRSTNKFDEITNPVQKMARLFIEQGVTDWKTLVDKVHAKLQQYDPAITRLEAMDAISGRGKFTLPSQDKVSVVLRDLKTQIRLLAHQIDVVAGKALPRTGVQRDQMSDAARKEQRVLRDLMMKYGVKVSDPAAQLSSLLATQKRYYQNRIADLAMEIKSRERVVKTKRELPTDATLEALKAEHKQLKAEHEAIFSKDLTDEQRIKMAISAAERQTKEYDRMVKDKEFNQPKERFTKTSPELEAAKQRLEASRATFRELQALDADFQRAKILKDLEAQKAALEKSMAEKEAKLASGNVNETTGQKQNRPASDTELEKMLQENAALNKKLAEARKKPAEQLYADSLARKLAEKQKLIEEKRAKLAAGDVAPKKGKVNRPLENKELELAQQELDKLNKQIQEQRNPTISPELRALQSFKTKKLNEAAFWSDKLAKGDYSTPTKRKPMVRDHEAEKLASAAFEAKKEWTEAMMKEAQKHWPVWKKTGMGVVNLLNTQRAITTSMDLSAVLRQGGFIALGHPVRALKSFPAMFRAFYSKAGEHAVMAEIKSRDNYPLYRIAKLYLSEQGHALSKMEESYMTNWAERVPLVAGSQRAYTTFLNKLRADSFDALAQTLARKRELTPREARAIANYVNVSTGRGSVGLKHDAALAGLATVFFAPRYTASRFQLLMGTPMYGGTARTRALVAKEYARFITGVATVYALGKMAGATVETDPRSSQFAKMKWGNTRVDPLSGLLQNIVLLTRIRTGETKQASGKIVPLRGPGVTSRGPNMSKTLTSWTRTKLSPSFGMAYDQITQTDFLDRPLPPMSPGYVWDKVKPMVLQDVIPIMKEHGVYAGTVLNILQLFGAGIQNYTSGVKSGR